MDTILTFPVTQEAKLLEFLLQAMPGRKRTILKQFLAHNQVAVNGTAQRQFDLQLNPGDKVEVNLTREFRSFYHRRLKLVYEDDDIIVVNKGYGLLSVATDREDKKNVETAYSILRDYLKWHEPDKKLFVVHRLDRDTSGLMMFAKNEESQEALQHNWNNMVLERKYLALVEGTPEHEKGQIKSYLTENVQHEVYSTRVPGEGKLAVTRYKVLENYGPYSLLEVSLDTGRKNQIRVHMKDLGHPIVGDKRYGAKTGPIRRLGLHAQTLKFAHPRTKKLMDFSTPIPAKFRNPQ